ncbi:MAG: winged helix-turn-helix domain-containing protein [Dehalococcoidia bacterium]
MKVLFIGTDPQGAMKVGLAVRLRWPDARILVSSNADDGVGEVERQTPDVVIFQSDSKTRPVERFIENLRSFCDVPLVVLEDEEGGGYMEEVKALESGADDYIRQSAGIIDLVARLVALIRRVKRMDLSGENRLLSNGSLTLIPATYEVFLDDRRLALTSTEFRMLHILMSNRGNVVTHDFIARSLWGDSVDSSSLVKKYIQRLRRKIGDCSQSPHCIVNVHGVGYRILGSQTSGEESPKVTV